jgi:hypothetical protein
MKLTWTMLDNRSTRAAVEVAAAAEVVAAVVAVVAGAVAVEVVVEAAAAVAAVEQGSREFPGRQIRGRLVRRGPRKSAGSGGQPHAAGAA